MPFDGAYLPDRPVRPRPHPLRTLAAAVRLIVLVPLLLLVALVQTVALVLGTLRRRPV